MRTILCALAITAVMASTASAQAPVADYYSTTSLWDGALLPEGMTIEAFDEDGIRCGYAEANADGSFLVHVYGNDPMTPSIDEGAREGEMLEWRINDMAPNNIEWIANLIGLFGDLRFENGAAKEMQMSASPTPVEITTWAEVKEVYRR